jgi:hypothetical protein
MSTNKNNEKPAGKSDSFFSLPLILTPFFRQYKDLIFEVEKKKFSFF